MKTRTIQNIVLFLCEPNQCWMSETGCENIRAAADNAAYCIKAGVNIENMDDINLKRLSECCGCTKYGTLTEKEFTAYFKRLIKQYDQQLSAVDLIGREESFYDAKRRRYREWYNKHVKKGGAK